jgi:predicted GNAT family acetyltransferase
LLSSIAPPTWLGADFSPACGIGAYDLNGGIKKAGGAVDGGSVYLWEDSRPVSMAAHMRDTSDSAFIGMVYTPPHLRGKGYATACVAALSQRLLEDGYPSCALYADCANPHSNKIYRALGYEHISVSDQFRIDE